MRRFYFGIYALTNTEAIEAPRQDFEVGEAAYTYLDNAMDIPKGVELGLHIDFHTGDFNEAFNGILGFYTDYNISLSKDGFSLVITDTDLDDAGPDGLDNDKIKFLVGYSMDFEL